LTAVLLALCASMSWGVADFGAGIASRRLAVPLVLVGTQAAGLLFAATVVLVTGQDPPSAGQVAWAGLSGGVGALGLFAFYRALTVGAMGIVGAISACAAVVPLTYGLARGERPSAPQLAGVALAVVGVVGASIESHPETRARRIGAGVGFSLLAALGFGCSLIALSKAAAGGWAWAPLAMRSVSLPLGVLAVLFVRPALTGFRGNALLLAGVGIGDTAANMFIGLAFTRGLVSVVSVLGSLYPVVLVAMARVFLHERIARHQLGGVAIALSGVALISAG
jgi:drug/metabolite transporter (DMT)-like permease